MAQRKYMTTTFNEPIDFYNHAAKVYESLPKTQTEIKDTLSKIGSVITTEYANGQSAMQTYTKALTGDASANDIAKANNKAADLIRTAALAFILATPGSIFTLPLIIDKAKEHSINLVPASVSNLFKI